MSYSSVSSVNLNNSTTFTAAMPTFTGQPNQLLLVTMGRYIGSQTAQVPAPPAGTDWVLTSGALNTNFGTSCHLFTYFNPPQSLSGASVTFTYGATGARTVAIAAILTDVVSIGTGFSNVNFSGNRSTRSIWVDSQASQPTDLVVVSAVANGGTDSYAPVDFSPAATVSHQDIAFSEYATLEGSGRNMGVMLAIGTAGASTTGERAFQVQIAANPATGTNFAAAGALLQPVTNASPQLPLLRRKLAVGDREVTLHLKTADGYIPDLPA